MEWDWTMKPELIVMLTYNDQTVQNAHELFDEMKNMSIGHWGLKDVGLSALRMKALVAGMKDAGKTTYLEVVSLSEREGLVGAKLAVESGFDVLMGTVFFDSINEYLRDRPIKYYPFPGHVHSHPSVLDGSIDEVVAHTKSMEAAGVDGFDLLAYRYTGDPAALLREVVAATTLPVVCAGSIASYDRIVEVEQAGAWGFTIGSAFFDKKFVEGGSFQENVVAVLNWLNK